MDSDYFDDKAISFAKIKTQLLMKSFGKKMRLIPIHTVVVFSCNAEDPFAFNYIHGGCGRIQDPSTILQKSIKLIGHCSTPHTMFNNVRETSWLTFN
jgi:hypothetical protein